VKRLLLLAGIGLLSFSVFSQEYDFRQYRVENGLPSDIIKACAQDSAGYFWIATDEGLVKYDGIKFTSYKEALHSSYAKGFYKTRSGRLLLFGDLDLVEIINRGDTVLFKSIRLGTRNPNDSTLWYPKSVYEDTKGNLWVGEPQSVVRLKDREFERFPFGAETRSPQFLRSFSFFEDRKGELYCTAFNGLLYRFNAGTNRFEKLPVQLPVDLEHVSVNDNQLLIASGTGFYIAPLLAEGGIGSPDLKLRVPRVSYIAPLPNHQFIIATRDAQHFMWTPDQGRFAPLAQSINNVNNIYQSQENDLWFSSNEGLYLGRRKTFLSASENLNDFIETTTELRGHHKIYYATMTSLYEFDRALGHDKSNKNLLTLPSGYFQSMAFSTEGTWVAYSSSLILFSDGVIKKKYDFDAEGRFITDVIADSKGRVWLSQAGNTNALVVNADKSVSRIPVPLEKEGTINIIREGIDGMYAASTGTTAYLYFKSEKDSVFKNVSVKAGFKTYGDFNVTDMAFMNSTLWMASSEGLLKFDGHTIEPIDIGPQLSRLSVKSVEVYEKNKLLFSNAFGLILFDPATGNYSLFNESSGLHSNTITTRGLFVANDQSVWIGTSKGLCYVEGSLSLTRKTPSPKFIELTANGKKIALHGGKMIEYGSFITLSISSITFPEKEVIIQYRLNHEPEWHLVVESKINLSNLKSGVNQLEARARKNGGYTWSESSFLSFEVEKPFWQRSWFYLFCALTVATLVMISIAWANARYKKRREELTQLIQERTNALRISNEELSIRNNELDRFVYSASHDLSAPLKSILGLIAIAKMEKPPATIDHYLDLMNRSVLKLDSFIRDIISYSRNARLPVEKKPIDFKSLIESIWADHQFSPNVNKIRLEIASDLKSPLLSDETRLKIIFNNLISNAIKFHRVDKGENLFVKITATEFPDHFEFVAEDNGTGIPDDAKDKIFNMFYRATEKVQGSGLGLYILKEAILKLGGTVTVDTSLGEGSTFRIKLPR
jgi:signal transduction histidine kinase